MANVEESRPAAGSSGAPLSTEWQLMPLWSRVLFTWAAFNAVNLVAELVGYDSREQPWWLRLLASLVALLIAIPVGEGIARGAVRLFGRGSRD